MSAVKAEKLKHQAQYYSDLCRVCGNRMPLYRTMLYNLIRSSAENGYHILISESGQASVIDYSGDDENARI